MRAYDLHERAVADLLDLAEFARAYDEEAGDELVDDVFDSFERLSAFPHLGRRRPELAPALRSFALNRRRVTVFYYAQPNAHDRVLIARVLRQERGVGASEFEEV
ncbi:type II toxin-antitoxin system RelE/ParE family toxin [Rubrivirga sp. S365]|uniref:Type II toxin-antitoxin system RelE/ParE family toxin n=1 Tax=Rubrivirga litoralis TaxID=3075598 RepID=A0ABU3BML3_9BACT|nr:MULTISPECIES: type II toxin-antitoxin system RelE/ParE family toxin [unclassified Rubrivirga]MDT0630540.1 type II toxin-antitoxin system RelE/ParE family toxin [Rubrivirga sp. F394]MDT7856845.1 type II toxin-antitoxin system RelE/ParE family toxin [Rubrivirga sp. S365]